MNTHSRVLELNDTALLLGDGKAAPLRSPGYATITRNGVITGEAARARARREPRQTLNQFWLRLGTEALHEAHDHARHHADLAWAQLQQLATAANGAQQLILAVPGSFTREQLAVLLGVVQRTAFRATGLVDSALAAASTVTIRGATLHLDLQLHQCVLTRIGHEADMLTRESVRTLPGCGLVQLYERWAQLLARRFIQQSRFDPMHAAASEQQLYDRIPDWLDMLHGSEDAAVEIHSNANVYHAKLRAPDVLDAARPIYTQIVQAVQRELGAGSALLLASARFAALPGIGELLPAFTSLEEQAAIRGCLRHEALIGSNDTTLRFVTRLPASEASPDGNGQPADKLDAPPAPPPLLASPVLPSHLVIGGRALRLRPGSLYLCHDRDGWTLSQHMPQTYAGTLRWDGSRWLLVPAPGTMLRLDGVPVSAPLPVQAGQHLQPDDGDDTLRLVAESAVDDDGP